MNFCPPQIHTILFHWFISDILAIKCSIISLRLSADVLVFVFLFYQIMHRVACLPFVCFTQLIDGWDALFAVQIYSTLLSCLIFCFCSLCQYHSCIDQSNKQTVGQKTYMKVYKYLFEVLIFQNSYVSTIRLMVSNRIWKTHEIIIIKWSNFV